MIESIASEENMRESLRKLCKGKRDRQSVIYALEHQEEVISEARNILLSGSYKSERPLRHTRIERGKKRNITYTSGIIDNLIRHSVSRAFDFMLVPKMQPGVSSNIKGRGSHYCMKMMIDEARNGKYRYYLQEDVKSYFASIDHDILLRIIKEESGCGHESVDLVREMISICPEGIAIGTVDCQLWANVYLMQMDRHIIRKYGSITAYGRYCDNIYILCDDIMTLHNIHQDILSFAKRLKLRMNPCVIGAVKDGMRVLSAVIYPDHIRIRKRVVEAMKRSGNISSYFGFMKIGNTHNLIRKYMYKKFNEIIDIPEYITSFTGDKRELSSLVGKRIVITDCAIEKGKFTDREGRVRDRAKIAFKFNEEDDREYICFSSSKPIMHYCSAFASDKEKYLPMEVVIDKNQKQYRFKAYED